MKSVNLHITASKSAENIHLRDSLRSAFSNIFHPNYFGESGAGVSATGSFFQGRSGFPSATEAYLAAANSRSLKRFTYLVVGRKTR